MAKECLDLEHAVLVTTIAVLKIRKVLGPNFLYEHPTRLIRHEPPDREAFDRQMQEQFWLELRAPHRSNRIGQRQDLLSLSLRSYGQYWNVVSLIAWLIVFLLLVSRPINSAHYSGR